MQARQDSALPKVLLIGDSISIGYSPFVQSMLEGRASVHRPPVNCKHTRLALEQLDVWLGTEPWDVIHFNFGLHDLKYVRPGGDRPMDPSHPESVQQVSLVDYRRNLEDIVERLERTGARLIWASTTPVPPGARGRIPADAVRYNAIAQGVMLEHGIGTNDLHGLVESHRETLQKPNNVHFREEGSRLLGEQVVRAIEAALSADD